MAGVRHPHMKAFDRSKEEAGSDIAALLDHTIDQHNARTKAEGELDHLNRRVEVMAASEEAQSRAY